MKHTKISKLVSVVLAVCVMLLGAVSVSAESYVNAVQDIASTKIAVTGFTEDINLAGITLVLLDPSIKDDPETEADEVKAAVDAMVEGGTWDEAVVVSVDQVYANADGTYTHEFILKTDAAFGEYTLVATSNDVAETTFYFASPETRKGALADILEAEATGEATVEEVIVAIIDLQGENLGIDTEFWAELEEAAGAKEDVATAVSKNEVLKDMNPDELTDEDIAAAAAEINAEALTVALNEALIEDIADYEDKVKDAEAMAEYKELTEEAKEYAMDLITDKGYKSAAKMEEAFAQAVEIAFMTVDGVTDLEKFAESANDLGLEKAEYFDDLTDTQKRAVADAVAAAKAKNLTDINKAFKTEVGKYTTVKEEKPKEPTYITSGGGGGGGSSSNKDEKEEETTTPEPEVVTPQVTYIDLDGYDWAKDAIYSLSEKKILAGYGDGIFNPANQIKREEFAKVIVTAIYGEEAVNANKAPSFADAKSGWYTPYVGYAESTGLIKGVSATEFGIGNNITRQDIMTILYRVMLAKGYSANTTAIAYGDAASIADYAKDAVFALANAGVVGGYEDGSIRPTNQATRAEVAIMVDKFMKLF